MSANPLRGLSVAPATSASPQRCGTQPVAARLPAAGLLITATVLTRNSARRLNDVLSALSWCDEIVVLDTGSIDDTSVIACRFSNVMYHRLEGEFRGFGQARQRAVALARNDWILSIDSDEVVSNALASEIGTLALDPDTVYSIPFANHFNGRQVMSCGWYPDRHDRLFNRKSTNFCASHVHERVRGSGLRNVFLKGHIDHYSYDSLDDFLCKMRSYSMLFASQHRGTRRSSPWTAVRHSTWTFAKSYFIQRGVLEGYEGFLISAYKAQTTFWKYLLLYEQNGRK